MSSKWNPNAPDTSGIEYLPTRSGLASIGLTPGLGVVLDATTSEAIRSVDAFVQGGNVKGGVQTDEGVVAASALAVDVYDASDLVGNPPWTAHNVGWSVANSLPVADAYVEKRIVGDYFTSQSGTTANLYQSLDENDANFSTTDWVNYINPQGWGRYGIGFNIGNTYRDNVSNAAVSLTGKRIGGVRVRAIVANKSTHFPAQVNATCGDYASQPLLKSQSPTTTVPADGGVQHDYRWTFTVNPLTSAPWQPTDLASFGPGTTGFFGIELATGATGAAVRIYALSVEVLYLPDTRVAFGITYVTPTDGPEWRRVNVKTPSNGIWSKVAGKRYWIVFSSPSTLFGSPAVPLSIGYLAGTDVLTGHHKIRVPLRSATILDYTAKWPPPVYTEAITFALELNGGGMSIDSQVYGSLDDVPVYLNSGLTGQEFSALSTAQPYGIVGVYVRAPADAMPTAPLAVEVIDRTNGDTTVAGPYFLNPAAMGTDTGVPEYMRFELPAPFTPVAGHQYATAFSSTTPITNPWLVYSLSTLDNPLLTPHSPAGFGGPLDAGIMAGVRDTTSDLVTTLAVVPVAPSPLAAATYAFGLESTDCAPASLTAINLSWTASTLALGQFGYYELQRNDDVKGWQTIAKLVDPDVPHFYDFESRRNVAASYRVRTVRTDGAFSAWTNTATATATCGVNDFLLTTNVRPADSLGFTIEPEQPFEFLSASEEVKHRLYGRDYQVAYRPLEYRGDSFKRKVLVAFDSDVHPKGRAAFAPLVALTTAATPYLAVLDYDGSRWYASVTTSGGNRSEPGGRYTADIEVTEVSDVPAPAAESFAPSGTPATLTYADAPSGRYGDASGTYGTV